MARKRQAAAALTGAQELKPGLVVPEGRSTVTIQDDQNYLPGWSLYLYHRDFSSLDGTNDGRAILNTKETFLYSFEVETTHVCFFMCCFSHDHLSMVLYHSYWRDAAWALLSLHATILKLSLFLCVICPTLSASPRRACMLWYSSSQSIGLQHFRSVLRSVLLCFGYASKDYRLLKNWLRWRVPGVRTCSLLYFQDPLMVTGRSLVKLPFNCDTFEKNPVCGQLMHFRSVT